MCRFVSKSRHEIKAVSRRCQVVVTIVVFLLSRQEGLGRNFHASTVRIENFTLFQVCIAYLTLFSFAIKNRVKVQK